MVNEKLWETKKFDIKRKREEIIAKIMSLNGDQLFKVRDALQTKIPVEEENILSSNVVKDRIIEAINEADKEPLLEEIERGIDSVQEN
jgi:hypothetical protein